VSLVKTWSAAGAEGAERPPSARRARRGSEEPRRGVGPSAPSRRPITARTAVWTFIATSLAAVLIIAVAVVVAVQRSATSVAITDARDLTVAEGKAAITPVLSDGILSRDPVAVSRIDDSVRHNVLSDRVVRVKVWSADGTILYSNAPTLIGLVFPLGPDEKLSLGGGRPHALVSNLGQPENALERPYKKLLEVYDGIRTPSGQPLLFEAYLKFSSVTADSHRTLRLLIPAMLVGLALLLLVQIPLAWTMARRLERGRDAERRLLRRALDAGEVERRRIASDLHDGSVQSLAGTAMVLTGAAERAERAGLGDVAADVSGAASELRQGIRDLRTLIVGIVPPRLHEEGLAAALSDLVSPLRSRGVDTTLDVQAPLDCGDEVETLVYRSAQEAVRNTIRHARANHVEVRVTADNSSTRLEVFDDGVGFDAESAAARRRGGHVGLRLLSELVADAGGHVDVASAPGAGTRVVVELPLR
jgi:two-component system NarL family sensor kinase